MSDPQTVNTGLSVPVRGSNVGVWDTPVNGDFVALDGFQGGVQTIGVAASPITLSVPAGFTATPSAGPTQAQNAVLRFTGVQTANVTITLPMPGYYIVENLLTGNVGWVLQFQAVTATQIISVDRGMCQHIYNDGANVRFVNLGKPCEMEFWAGYTAMPAWVSNCTVPPYLLCDGSIYNFSTYPVLGSRFLASFGGNGVSTFGVPDMRGRVPLAYDGTGTRITAAVSGINGQTIGASADNQGITLTASQLPSITVSGSNNIIVKSQNGFTGIPTTTTGGNISGGVANSTGGTFFVPGSSSGSWAGVDSLSGANTVTATSSNTGGQAHSNVQPAQVAGIWVVRAA